MAFLSVVLDVENNEDVDVSLLQRGDHGVPHVRARQERVSNLHLLGNGISYVRLSRGCCRRLQARNFQVAPELLESLCDRSSHLRFMFRYTAPERTMRYGL